jgi:hypothetical protein
MRGRVSPENETAAHGSGRCEIAAFEGLLPRLDGELRSVECDRVIGTLGYYL